jgi:hypothetical protein
MPRKRKSKKTKLLKPQRRISYGHKLSFEMKDLNVEKIPNPVSYHIEKKYKNVASDEKYFHLFSDNKKIKLKFKEIEYRYCGYPFIKKYVIYKYKIQEYIFDILMFMAPIGVFTKEDFEFFIQKVSGRVIKAIDIFVGMGIISQPFELPNNPNKLYKLSSLGYDIVNDFFFYMNRFHEFGTKDYLEKEEMLINLKGDENMFYYKAVVEEVMQEIIAEEHKVTVLKRDIRRANVTESDRKFIEVAYFYFKQSSNQIASITGYSSFIVRNIIIPLKQTYSLRKNKEINDSKHDMVRKLWLLHLKREDKI